MKLTARSRRLHVASALGLILTLWWAVPVAAQAPAGPPIDQVATKYLDLYFAGKIAELAPYLTPQSEFVDPTMTAKGGTEIVAALTPLFGGISELKFERERQFLSGADRFVLQGKIQFKLAGMLVDGSNRVYALKTPFIVVLRIENGKVLHHVDYYDSLDVLGQISQQGQQ